MKTLEYLSKASSGIGQRPFLRIALVGTVTFVLLLAATGLLVSPGQAKEDGKVHVTGSVSFRTVLPRVYINSISGLTISDLNVLGDYTGTIVGKTESLNTAATDATTHLLRATGYGTFWGTVGDSAPGVFSFTVTYTLDTTTPTAEHFNGIIVFVNGSGMGGLEDICGSFTSTGIFDATTAITITATYDGTVQLGGSCNSQD